MVRDIPSEVFLSKVDGMPRDCAVNCDHLQTVSKGKIGSLISTLSRSKMADVGQAIRFALDIRNITGQQIIWADADYSEAFYRTPQAAPLNFSVRAIIIINIDSRIQTRGLEMKQIKIRQYKNGELKSIDDPVAEEAIAHIEINDEVSFDTIISPVGPDEGNDIKSYVYGNLYTEGFIKSQDEILKYQDGWVSHEPYSTLFATLSIQKVEIFWSRHFIKSTIHFIKSYEEFNKNFT